MADLTGTAYGGFWIRVIAYLVDTVVLFIGFVVLGAVCALLGPAGIPILGAAGILGPILYWGLMQASARQATFGKSLLGMKVTDTSGNRLSIPRSLVREVAKILSGLILMIGFVMAAFTGRKQALHDMIASTVVVRESPGHVVAGLAIGLLGWMAPVALVMVVGMGFFVGLMGGMFKDMQGAMVEEMKKGPPMQQTAQSAPAPVVPRLPAPVQVAAAPAQTAAAPVAGPAGADALFNTRLPGFQTPGTTRAGPVVLEFDAQFTDSFWLKAHLPAAKEFEGKPLKLVVSRVIDAKGADLFDPANTFESEFFQKVSMKDEASPVKHLAGTRTIHLKKGANAKSVDKVEGTLELAVPLNPAIATFASADVDKQKTVHGVAITFKGFRGKDATVEYKDKDARVVSINGYGTDQKPVSSNGWSGSGDSMTYQFNAPVARVDVVVAESFARRSYPFVLAKTSVTGPAAAAPVATAPAPRPVPVVEVAKAVPPPGPAPAQPAPAVKAQKMAAAGPQAAARTHTKANEDARHCLDLATEVAIVRCAEKYR